jgi:beta-glucosidase
MLIKFVLLLLPILFPSLLSSLLIESEVKNVFAFPKNFSFGASTAAYQIEGGFDADGKGPSIWDTLVHDHPEMIADGTSGDIGDDSYHHFMDDVNALKEVGVSFILFKFASIHFTTSSSNIIASPYHGREYFRMERQSMSKHLIIMIN